MNLIQNPAAAQPGAAPASNVRGMMLHCGADTVTREDVFAVKTPPGTDTWYPLSHRSLLNDVQAELKACGFNLEGERHALSHEGARYFGVFAISLPSRSQADTGWVVGLRNSHDKTYPAGLVAGTRVFVCDNLSFSGEVRLSRKHTKFAFRDLRQLMARAVGQLGEKFRKLDERVEAYRIQPFGDRDAHDFIVRSIDSRVITPTQVPDVLKEWREPSFEAFRPRTLWSLHNAFTEVFKAGNPHTTIHRSQALHGLCDAVVGLPS